MIRSRRILVVEDDAPLRLVYAQMLRGEGFEVCEASSGKEGLQIARENRPGLVLLDVTLPDGSGIEVCRQLKADPRLASLFVALVSGDAVNGAHKALALETGADDHLVKPVALSELRARVRTLRRLRDATVALHESEERYRQVQEELLEISASERRRIGHELHDGLGQYLAGIAFRAKALEQTLAREASRHTGRARELTTLVSNAIRQTRSVARGLDPVQVETSGLPAALQNLASEATHFFNLTCVFRCPQAGPGVDAETGLTLYRLTQEAIHNAVRHGEARRIEILLEWTSEHLCLRIRDDGAGFNAQDHNLTGLGLRVMKYRAGAIGARLQIDSTVGRGTEVRCEVPRSRCRLVAPAPAVGAGSPGV